ncbi:hypothetical protein KIN20_009880 [Parelaphostrongylus tenuis]|uniref:Uncharacterized protein n=1 Tax=Parelaphostrongylus tenuis TaxID=148309 RepID=A0AAD5MSG8_PARTN|nr:hypothetical protein KIN20_009880 [Parelaphostrongylus tenuis]
MFSPLTGNSLPVAENFQKPEEKVHDEISEQELSKKKRNTKEESMESADEEYHNCGRHVLVESAGHGIMTSGIKHDGVFNQCFDPPEPSAHHTSLFTETI